MLKTKTKTQADVTRGGSASGGEPFGVYVHWPFCAAKCPYCDFNSHVRHGGIDAERFLGGYLRELSHFAERAPDMRFFIIRGLVPSRVVATVVDTEPRS